MLRSPRPAEEHRVVEGPVPHGLGSFVLLSMSVHVVWIAHNYISNLFILILLCCVPHGLGFFFVDNFCLLLIFTCFCCVCWIVHDVLLFVPRGLGYVLCLLFGLIIYHLCFCLTIVVFVCCSFLGLSVVGLFIYSSVIFICSTWPRIFFPCQSSML